MVPYGNVEKTNLQLLPLHFDITLYICLELKPKDVDKWYIQIKDTI